MCVPRTPMTSAEIKTQTPCLLFWSKQQVSYALIPLRVCLHEAVVYSPLSTDLTNPFILSCQNKHRFTEINVGHNCALGQARHFLSEISSFLCFLEKFWLEEKDIYFLLGVFFPYLCKFT